MYASSLMKNIHMCHDPSGTCARRKYTNIYCNDWKDPENRKISTHKIITGNSSMYDTAQSTMKHILVHVPFAAPDIAVRQELMPLCLH